MLKYTFKMSLPEEFTLTFVLPVFWFIGQQEMRSLILEKDVLQMLEKLDLLDKVKENYFIAMSELM
ncbi:Uncharacterized protein APZ42_028831 [Daphnia magna]|uniref:Uncharacterized protein n=1 Tax=Daphnia magna TaxID=35525 RepID=A0A164Q581_9CRUS|nr:Uncharacterized protein APZ42_028831 [Daphnia magna]